MSNELEALENQLEPQSGETLPAPPAELRLPKRTRWAISAVLVVLALASALFLGPFLSSPSVHAGTIEKLDGQRNAVIGLMTTSTAASAAISAIPDDAGTPIAEKLMDVTGDFTVVLTAIYLEKYALSLTALLAFCLLVPLALLVLAFLIARGKVDEAGKRWGLLAVKVAVFGVLLCCVVPASVGISDIINDTYGVSVEETATQTDADASTTQGESSDGGSIIDNLNNLISTATNGISDILDTVQNTVNDLLEKLAVLIVTSCVMPLLVIAFCVWAVNFLFGTNLNIPVGKMRGAVKGGMRKARGSRQ